MDDDIRTQGALAAHRYRQRRAAAGKVLYRCWIPGDARELIDTAVRAALVEFARAQLTTETAPDQANSAAVEEVAEFKVILVDLTEAAKTEKLIELLDEAEFKPSTRNPNKYLGERLPDRLAELLQQLGATVTPHLVRRVRHRDGSLKNEWKPFP